MKRLLEQDLVERVVLISVIAISNRHVWLPLLLNLVEERCWDLVKEETLEQGFAEVGILDDVERLLQDVEARAYRDVRLVLEYAE